MRKFIKKPDVVEAITFEELIEHGRNQTPVATADNGGIPINFEWKGRVVTRDINNIYLVELYHRDDYNNNKNQYLVRFSPGNVLIYYSTENGYGYLDLVDSNDFANGYKEVNENDYCLPLKINTGTFGMAIEAAKSGLKVARVGWNGSGMFVYYVPDAYYPVVTNVMEDFFGKKSMIPYRAYLALKTAQDDVATWAPSCSDVLAEDWIIVK